jgi:maleylacetate reductase
MACHVVYGHASRALLKNHFVSRGWRHASSFQTVHQGCHVVYGHASRALLKNHLVSRGWRHALVVCTPVCSEQAARTESRLGELSVGLVSDGGDAVHFEESVRRTRASVSAHSADVLIALGGGSVIDVGKSVALLEDLPLVAIPTTYSGSEMTNVHRMTADGGRTLLARDDRCRPQLCIFDSSLSADLPLATSVSSAFSAVSNAVEALWAEGADPITLLVAEEAVRLIASALPTLADDPADAAARDALLLGAYLSGCALHEGPVSVGRCLGTLLEKRKFSGAGDSFMSHADAATVLLPHLVDFNARSFEPSIRFRTTSSRAFAALPEHDQQHSVSGDGRASADSSDADGATFRGAVGGVGGVGGAAYGGAEQGGLGGEESVQQYSSAASALDRLARALLVERNEVVAELVRLRGLVRGPSALRDLGLAGDSLDDLTEQVIELQSSSTHIASFATRPLRFPSLRRLLHDAHAGAFPSDGAGSMQ